MRFHHWLAVGALLWACGGRSEHKAGTQPLSGDDDTTGATGGTKPGASGKGGQTGAGATAATGASGGADGTAATDGSGATDGAGANPGNEPGGAFGAGATGATGATGTGATGATAATGADASGGTPGRAGGGAGPAVSVGGGGTNVCGPNGCVYEPDVPAIEPPGPALCGGIACQANELCCLVTGECFDPKTNGGDCVAPPPNTDVGGRAPCASNADCNQIEFCELDDRRLCQGPGHCQAIGNCGGCGDGSNSGACTVCACDGNTYPDFQTACLARASTTWTWGAGCGVSIDIGGGDAGSRGGGGSSPPRIVTPCGTDEQCAGGELCCGITARCYPKSEPGQCATPPDGTTFPCTTNEQCNAYEFCQGDGCEGPGGCVQMDNGDCGVTLEPVCGCDGTTYTSAACAATRGVRVASDGECSAK